jgi:3-oxoacyl-[acyl-carrier-protein] synthase-3
MNSRMPVELRGTGVYVPDRIIDNNHFVGYLDTSEEWILTRTGIRERHWASKDQATSDLGLEAARRALVDANMTIDDIDVIICATATGDHPFPSTAAIIQGKLGCTRPIPAFDVGAACAGFMFGSAVAAGLIMGGTFKTALVIGAETLSRYADPDDRSTVILFGDAGGAAVWSRSRDEHTGIQHLELGSDGTKADYIWLPAGGSRVYASTMTVNERLHYIRMKGREVFKFAVLKMEEIIDRALSELGITPADLKYVIPHQSNLRIIESMRERMQLPKEKMAVNIDQYGNTSAASILLSLDAARRSGRIAKGDLVLFVAIGAGLAWGTMVVRM